MLLPPPQSAQVATIVRTVMREEHIAALSVGIGRHGETLYLRGFGERDLARHLPADGYTIYRAGSITKQFTAAAMMRQVERNAVSLAAPVRAYLPSLAQPAAAVTIAQLLTQTSGIASDTDAGATFASAIAAPLEFPAGTSWAYSNTNYSLLGDVLQGQLHRSFPDIVRDEIARPLHLVSTACALPPYAQNVARGYRHDGDRFAPFDNAARTERAGAAAALVTNAPDLLQWLDAFYSGRVVSQASFAAMTHDTRLPDGSRTHYGYGFFIRDWYGYHVAEHAGHVDGYSSDDALVLDDGLEVAVLSNADRVDLVPLTQAIVAIVDAPKDANLYADHPRPPENEDPAVTATVRTVVAQLQIGTLDAALLTPRLASSLTRAQIDADAAVLRGLGRPRLIEFTERTRTDDISCDRYRITFSGKTVWMTIGYRADRKIDALHFETDTD